MKHWVTFYVELNAVELTAKKVKFQEVSWAGNVTVNMAFGVKYTQELCQDKFPNVWKYSRKHPGIVPIPILISFHVSNSFPAHDVPGNFFFYLWESSDEDSHTGDGTNFSE